MFGSAEGNMPEAGRAASMLGEAMSEDDEGLRSKGGFSTRHVIGERLDDLSIFEFDERIALLRAEIARLEAAKHGKEAAVNQAGSLFKG